MQRTVRRTIKMNRVLAVSILVTMVSAHMPAYGACTLPQESPVPAPAPDDIPPGRGAWLRDYQGNWFEGKANHVMAFVQINSNEQKVWFSVESSPHHGIVFYNRRYRTSATAPWQWAYSRSLPLIWYPNGSMVVNAVLYSPTPKYGRGSAYYKYVMFTTYQPEACNGNIAGFAYVSFSQDGFCWTTPEPMRREGGPSGDPTSACPSAELGSDLVPVEAFDVAGKKSIDSDTAGYPFG